MFCLHCGAELPDYARFCFLCGEKVGKPTPAASGAPKSAANNAPPEPGTPERAESSVLAKIFSELDSAACRSEYYHLFNGNPMLCGYSMAVNGNWVLHHISQFPNDEFILTDADRQAEIRLDIQVKLRKTEYKNLMGFNSSGVWFLIRSHEGTKFFNVKFLCVDVVRNRYYEYPIENPGGTISDVYIFGDEILYIKETSDDEHFLHHVTRHESEELFAVYRSERIFRLSATETRFAWGYANDRDGKECWYWYFYDRATKQLSSIRIPRHPIRLSVPSFEVLSVDLVKNIMMTTLTQNEAARLGVPETSLAVRKLENPVEHRFLTYKTDRQPAVWRIDCAEKDFFFDGSVYYAVPSGAELHRYDRFGARSVLGDSRGNGMCQNLLVTDKWLYVNYDAHDMVRLPKLFSPCAEGSQDNPEAFFIFGQNQNFKM